MLSIARIYRFTGDLSTTYAIYVMQRLLTRTKSGNKGENAELPYIKTRCAALVGKHSLCILTMKVKCAIERLGCDCIDTLK